MRHRGPARYVRPIAVTAFAAALIAAGIWASMHGGTARPTPSPAPTLRVFTNPMHLEIHLEGTKPPKVIYIDTPLPPGSKNCGKKRTGAVWMSGNDENSSGANHSAANKQTDSYYVCN